jgi:glutaconate CoA-transferase subunit B
VSYSVDELRACVISREFEDGERVMLGANVGPGRAGLVLAHVLRGPNMRLLLGMSWSNYAGETEIPLHPTMADFRNARRAEAFQKMDVWPYEYKNFFWTAFIVSGLQVDRFGNTNLIGIGDDHRRLRVRGPGAVGSTSSTAYADRFYIMPPRHTTDVLVERCDFVSSVGWHEGGADAREKLGLAGGGPKLCVTERCVFDFDDVTKAMRLKSLHPGHTVAEVVEHTGFDVVIPGQVPDTVPPTEEELHALRTVVDPEGTLRA